MTQHVLVTGATGFIGSRVIAELNRRQVATRTLSRRPLERADARIGDLARPETLTGLCDGIDTVVHCAGFAHAHESGHEAFEAQHEAINHRGTRSLLDIASRAGVRRFVLLSSVKALATPGDRLIDEGFPGEPDSPYGRAKRTAEAAAFEASGRYGMQVVVLRLAMVYGAGDRGNLRRMVEGVRAGWFPPLPDTGNHRSLVHIDDAVEAILLAMSHPGAAGGCFIVAAEEAPSGAELYDAIRRMLGRPAPSWRIPASVLRSAGTAADRISRIIRKPLPVSSEMVDRLLGSAWYCPARIARELGWRARVPLSHGLRDYLGPRHRA